MTHSTVKWILVFGVICSSGCAALLSTPELAWKEAPGKTHDEMYKDSTVCLRNARMVRVGYHGDSARDQAMMITYAECMQAEGHTLVEVSK